MCIKCPKEVQTQKLKEMKKAHLPDYRDPQPRRHQSCMECGGVINNWGPKRTCKYVALSVTKWSGIEENIKQ